MKVNALLKIDTVDMDRLPDYADLKPLHEEVPKGERKYDIGAVPKRAGDGSLMVDYSVEISDDIKVSSPEEFAKIIKNQMNYDQKDMNERLGKNFEIKTHRLLRRLR